MARFDGAGEWSRKHLRQVGMLRCFIEGETLRFTMRTRRLDGAKLAVFGILTVAPHEHCEDKLAYSFLLRFPKIVCVSCYGAFVSSF